MLLIPIVRDILIVIAIRSMLVIRGRMSVFGFWVLALSISGLWRLFFWDVLCVNWFLWFSEVCFI